MPYEWKCYLYGFRIVLNRVPLLLIFVQVPKYISAYIRMLNLCIGYIYIYIYFFFFDATFIII